MNSTSRQFGRGSRAASGAGVGGLAGGVSGSAVSLPAVSKRGVALFSVYTRHYLRRHFHGVRRLRECASPVVGREPLLIYSNHASWWDPLVALVVQRELFPDRTMYGPIEAAALRRYAFLGRLGLFGVESDSPGGVRRFLRTAASILATEGSILWVTPQGRFADARERPPQFRAGLGHLVAGCPEVTMLPVAVEYTFWGERLPEVLIAFGETLRFGGEADRVMAPEDLNRLSAEHLASAQDRLARASVARESGAFEAILEGRAGVGGLYDGWRWCRSWVRGETFNPAHGA